MSYLFHPTEVTVVLPHVSHSCRVCISPSIPQLSWLSYSFLPITVMVVFPLAFHSCLSFINPSPSTAAMVIVLLSSHCRHGRLPPSLPQPSWLSYLFPSASVIVVLPLSSSCRGRLTYVFFPTAMVVLPFSSHSCRRSTHFHGVFLSTINVILSRKMWWNKMVGGAWGWRRAVAIWVIYPPHLAR